LGVGERPRVHGAWQEMRCRDYEERDGEGSGKERHGRARPRVEMWRHGGVRANGRAAKASQALRGVNGLLKLGDAAERSYQAN
jgi:hypothetical protein